MTEFKLVPVEPTDEMLEAGIRERQKNRASINPAKAWSAMLAAAPQQAAEPVAWMYLVNGVHVNFSSFEPPDDAYDAGTLVPLYAGHPPVQPDSIATCEWREDADGIWETACGEAWQCTEGTPVENDMKYCHSCGKHLKEMPYAAPGGE